MVSCQNVFALGDHMIHMHGGELKLDAKDGHLGGAGIERTSPVFTGYFGVKRGGLGRVQRDIGRKLVRGPGFASESRFPRVKIDFAGSM